MKETVLKVQNVSKRYSTDEKFIFKNVSFELYKGEILSITGPNGCGKSTLLRMISGLETITEGRIYYKDRLVKKPTKDILFLPQTTEQLFPWLSVEDNVIVPQILTSRTDRKKARDISEDKLSIVGITGHEMYAKYPSQLSGGQKQRVAIARALSPDIILLDEPFSAIDVSSRKTIGRMIKQLPEKEGVSIILISHHPEEINNISDRVFSLDSKSIPESDLYL